MHYVEQRNFYKVEPKSHRFGDQPAYLVRRINSYARTGQRPVGRISNHGSRSDNRIRDNNRNSQINFGRPASTRRCRKKGGGPNVSGVHIEPRK